MSVEIFRVKSIGNLDMNLGDESIIKILPFLFDNVFVMSVIKWTLEREQSDFKR